MSPRRPPGRHRDEPKILYDWAHPAQQMFDRVLAYLRRRSDLTDRFLTYHYDLHSELARQRKRITPHLHDALRAAAAKDYAFDAWQRTIRWKWGDHPLGAVGSLRAGGRFNIGSNIAPSIYPPFSAFYVAQNKRTADLEALGQPQAGSPLSAEELALANKESIITFAVRGKIDRVLDITDKATLSGFVDLVKDFTVSPSLVARARHLPVVPPSLVTTPTQLHNSLLNPNWRQVPSLCDVPANSQVFGQMVLDAGIQAILYPSKLTGEPCLAVFPKNFRGSTAWLELVDEPPKALIGPRRIDHSNFEACDRTTAEIEASPLRQTPTATPGPAPSAAHIPPTPPPTPPPPLPAGRR